MDIYLLFRTEKPQSKNERSNPLDHIPNAKIYSFTLPRGTNETTKLAEHEENSTPSPTWSLHFKAPWGMSLDVRKFVEPK